MLSLYIHIPFCGKKCSYCGFYSTPYSAQAADQFISSIRKEAASYREPLAKKTVETIYIGGGTPTTLAPDQFIRLAGNIKESFLISDSVEYTAEANPNTVTQQKLEFFLESGVNRLSIGVQSFSDQVLLSLGRIHTAQQAADAVKRARKSGFSNIGLDLIYGIPGQTVAIWRESLDRAIESAPDHISIYSLSLDKGSRFTQEAAAGNFAMPEDDTVAEMYELAANRLTGAGYGRYEISNFARPGFECLHNLNYWNRGEYLGLGPGAWSFMFGKRFSNIPDVNEYCRRLSAGMNPVEYEEVIDPESAAHESVMLGLRTAAGIDLSQFEGMYGKPALDRLLRNSERIRGCNLISRSSGSIRLTNRGILLSDDVIQRLCS